MTTINKTNYFKYPREYETMTVEQAISFLELAALDHHMYVYKDIYDFAYQLVQKCNINPNYVLNNLDKILESVHSSKTKEIINELKNNIVDKNTINLESYKQELETLKKKREETRQKEEEREKAIQNAKQRHEELTFLKKILINIKKEQPTDELFNSKTTNQINDMYTSKKSK